LGTFSKNTLRRNRGDTLFICFSNKLYITCFIVDSGEIKLKFNKNDFANNELPPIVVFLIAIAILIIFLVIIWPPLKAETCDQITSSWKIWPC
jgi:hypothetical protein